MLSPHEAASRRLDTGRLRLSHLTPSAPHKMMGLKSRGITFVACRNRSHLVAAAKFRQDQPTGAMPCRKSAVVHVRDIIEAEVLSARPRQSARADKEARLPESLLFTSQDMAVRDGISVPFRAAS